MNAMTPGSMLGAWKCIARDRIELKREPAPEAPVQRFAEPLAISLTTPPDFPILALADLLVRPFGAASTYSRCALGALGNLRGLQGTCKGAATEKTALCAF